MAVFCRLPSAFYSLLEELNKENTETRKNIRKMDDLLIFMTLEKHKKLTEMLQFRRMLTPCKKLTAFYDLNWANYHLLRFILNIQILNISGGV